MSTPVDKFTSGASEMTITTEDQKGGVVSVLVISNDDTSVVNMVPFHITIFSADSENDSSEGFESDSKTTGPISLGEKDGVKCNFS